MHTVRGSRTFLRGRAGPTGGKNRPTLIVGTLAALLVVFLAFQTVAFAVHDLGLFQLDYVLTPSPMGAANVSSTSISPPGNTGDDWDLVYAGTSSADVDVFVPDPSQAADTTYFTGGGSKDNQDIPNWQYGVGSNTTPDKNDLTDIFAAAYKPTTGSHAGHLLLYFGADRFATNGDSQVGFWFFRSPVSLGANGAFNGVHQVGDILVLTDMVNGGQIGNVLVYQWVGPPGMVQLLLNQSQADCSTAGPDDVVCAVINNIAGETPPWPYAKKGGGSSYNAGALFEGGLDVNALLNLPDAGCFSSFLGETRSAAAIDATLKDFALGSLNTCAPLSVTKDASTTFTRTYNWTISKSVTPDTWNMFKNDSGTSQYTVSVVKTGSTDSNWAVTGNIAIQNPNPSEDATITGVTDSVGGVTATVDCGVSFPYSLAGGGTLNCTYSASLPDGTSRTNTATVATSGPIAGGQGTASVTFGAPTTLVNNTIHVTDTNGGSWTFSNSGSQQYSKTFTCNTDQGKHDNTATITETGQSANASVQVNCYALDLTKDAATAFTRTFPWTISKSVTPDTWNMFQGDDGTSQYTVSLTKGAAVDSALLISGNIHVNNPAPVAATINSVADVVSPAIAATVNCGVSFPYSLAAGGTLNCTYSAVPPDETDRTNTATATLQNHSYDFQLNATATGTTDFSGTANVSFSGATITPVNDTVHVTDTNGGSWTFSASGSQMYSETFACNGDEGKHDNTATITETGQSASASVTVNCYALDVTKDASTSLTRTWTWTIQKTGDQSSLTLSTGQTFVVDYSIVVNATSADSNWAVSGNITVHNPAPVAAVINNVTDMISPSISATVDCGVSFPYTLAAGGDLHCTYSASLPDATSRLNTAQAALRNHSYDYLLNPTDKGLQTFSGTANISFASATINSVDECIHVTDTYAGDLGDVCAGVDTLPKTFTCSRTVGPYGTCGTYTVDNTAAFANNDTGATGDSSWTVTINVPCEGCTLTYGYWKTHSSYGPAPFDDTWDQILPSGADSPFFLSGQTWYEVLWTAPRGHAYYILADQYIGAVLNQLNGAGSTPQVDATIAAATTFFQTHTPADQLTKQQRNQVIQWAGILANYNRGAIGPGHCSEQSS